MTGAVMLTASSVPKRSSPLASAVSDVPAIAGCAAVETGALDQVGEQPALALVQRFVDLRELVQGGSAKIGNEQVMASEDFADRGRIELLGAQRLRDLLARPRQLLAHPLAGLAKLFCGRGKDFFLPRGGFHPLEQAAQPEAASP